MRFKRLSKITGSIRGALSAILWFTLPFWMVFIALAFIALWLRRPV